MQKSIINKKNYQLLYDSYYGTGGYDDASYLIKHKRETQEKYYNRQQMAYYLNYVKPTIDAHVNPIFAKTAQRETNNQLFEMFLTNVDGNNTDIETFVKQAALYTKLYGVVYIVMDNSNIQANNMQEVYTKRLYPYMYLVTPDLVEDIQLDKNNQILAFSYREKLDNDETEDIYQIKTFTRNGWKIGTVSASANKLNDEYEHYEGIYNIGQVPVIAFKSRESKEVMPTSEFLSIAKTNFNIYQLTSYLNEIYQNQAFSILTFPKDATQDNVSLNIGTSNALAYPSDASHTPSFIAPPAEPANMITEQIDRLVKEIYRMAGLSFTTGVQSQQSGISKAYDFESLNLILANFAKQVENLEHEIATLFAKWINQPVVYNVQYKKTFNISDITQDIEDVLNTLSVNVNSPTLKVNIIKKLVNSYLHDIPEDEKQNIYQEVEQSANNDYRNEQQAHYTNEMLNNIERTVTNNNG